MSYLARNAIANRQPLEDGDLQLVKISKFNTTYYIEFKLKFHLPSIKEVLTDLDFIARQHEMVVGAYINKLYGIYERVEVLTGKEELVGIRELEDELEQEQDEILERGRERELYNSFRLVHGDVEARMLAEYFSSLGHEPSQVHYVNIYFENRRLTFMGYTEDDAEFLDKIIDTLKSKRK